MLAHAGVAAELERAADSCRCARVWKERWQS